MKRTTRLARSKSSTLNDSSRRDFKETEVNGNKISQSTEQLPTTTNTTDTDTTQQLPQPKLSRATQKPHVRKNRRQSSLERRRARYARLDLHKSKLNSEKNFYFIFSKKKV